MRKTGHSKTSCSSWPTQGGLRKELVSSNAEKGSAELCKYVEKGPRLRHGRCTLGTRPPGFSCAPVSMRPAVRRFRFPSFQACSHGCCSSYKPCFPVVLCLANCSINHPVDITEQTASSHPAESAQQMLPVAPSLPAQRARLCCSSMGRPCTASSCCLQRGGLA